MREREGEKEGERRRRKEKEREVGILRGRAEYRFAGHVDLKRSELIAALIAKKGYINHPHS